MHKLKKASNDIETFFEFLFFTNNTLQSLFFYKKIKVETKCFKNVLNVHIFLNYATNLIIKF